MLAPCAKFHSSDGSYSWEDPKASSSNESGARGGGKRAAVDENIATNPYQVCRTDFLLREWTTRFPRPFFPNTVGPTSTAPTPQQTSHSGGSNTSNQTVSRLYLRTITTYNLSKYISF